MTLSAAAAVCVVDLLIILFFKVNKSKNVVSPYFVYFSAADNYVAYLSNKVCTVYSDGKINWAAPVIFKSYCNIDVTQFPFDKQSCKLKFGPWQHDASEVNLNGTGSILTI